MENEVQSQVNLANLSKVRLIEIILFVNEKNENIKADYQKLLT